MELNILKGCRSMDKEIGLMQKLEKNFIRIKNILYELWNIVGFILSVLLLIYCIYYYEDFFNWVFSCSVPPTSLFDYVENEPIIWKAFINRFLFVRPVVRNKYYEIGGNDLRHIYPNRSANEELAKWGWYDRAHFVRTFNLVVVRHYDWRVVFDPYKWDWSNRARYYPKEYVKTIFDLYKFSFREIDAIWPWVIGDGFELLIFHKLFHNLFEFPFAIIDKYFVDPFIIWPFINPLFHFFYVVNFKRDFLYYLSEASDNCDSLFLIPIAKRIVKIKTFLICDSYTFFTHDIWCSIYNKYFSDIVALYHLYIICCGFIGCNWGDIYNNFRLDTTLHIFTYCLNYVVDFSSSLLLNFFSAFWFNHFLAYGFERIFLENFFSLLLSYLFSIFLSNTILNKYFRMDFIRFLEDLCLFWVTTVEPFFINLFLLIIYIIFSPLIFLRYILIKYLDKEILLKILMFKSRCCEKFTLYRDILADNKDDNFWIDYCTKKK